MLYLILLALLSITSSQENCEDILCSNVIDYVCGAIEYKNGNVIFMKYKNICIMRQTSCLLKPVAEVYKAADILCNIYKPHSESRRRGVTDFSIVGAHQACNHTCPTYCVDTYEPACAKIWKADEDSYLKPMINHCHIDLFSCATGLNVTIMTISQCYSNPLGLLFMTQVAAMKTLNLLDDAVVQGA